MVDNVLYIPFKLLLLGWLILLFRDWNVVAAGRPAKILSVFEIALDPFGDPAAEQADNEDQAKEHAH